jgi:hypothetical protein
VREFLVTLRSGRRYTVRADQMTLIDGQYLGFIADAGRSLGGNPIDAAVGVFERGLVATVVAKDHLVAEEQGEPIAPSYVVGGDDSNIPF